MRKSDRKSLCTNRAACSAALNERRQLLVVANEHEHSTPLRSFDSTVAPTRAAATSTFPQEAKRTENSGAYIFKMEREVNRRNETKKKRKEERWWVLHDVQVHLRCLVNDAEVKSSSKRYTCARCGKARHTHNTGAGDDTIDRLHHAHACISCGRCRR